MKRFKIIFLVFIALSCNSKPDKTNQITSESIVDKNDEIEGISKSCITTKPVKNASDLYKPQNIEDTFLSDLDFNNLLADLNSSKVVIDSTVIYTTHKDSQREIIITKKCLKDTTSLGRVLMEEYFVSDFIYDEIKMIKTEKKKILNFGDALVYEFKIIGGSEYNPHNVILILKDNGSNYSGISLCSDGIRWKKNEEEEYIPLFVERVRIHKQYEIPMLYIKNKFVPLGHHKIPELWKED